MYIYILRMTLFNLKYVSLCEIHICVCICFVFLSVLILAYFNLNIITSTSRRRSNINAFCYFALGKGHFCEKLLYPQSAFVIAILSITVVFRTRESVGSCKRIVRPGLSLSLRDGTAESVATVPRIRGSLCCEHKDPPRKSLKRYTCCNYKAITALTPRASSNFTVAGELSIRTQMMLNVSSSTIARAYLPIECSWNVKLHKRFRGRREIFTGKFWQNVISRLAWKRALREPESKIRSSSGLDKNQV